MALFQAFYPERRITFLLKDSYHLQQKNRYSTPFRLTRHYQEQPGNKTIRTLCLQQNFHKVRNR